MAEHCEQVPEHTEQARLKDGHVSTSIREMLSFSLRSLDQPYITKVPNYLRKVKEEAYEPQVISIGPYHRGKPQLQAMEKQKIRFLQKLLAEKKTDVSFYVEKIRELEDKARQCYAADLGRSDLDSDDFVKMLLLDGVFIVQMIRLKIDENETPKYLLPLCQMVSSYSTGLSVALYQDMFLVENQLPFFVLWRLFPMIESRADNGKFIKAIFQMLKCTVPGKELRVDDLIHLNSWESDFMHLLDFAYRCCWHPSTSKMEETPTDDLNSLRLCVKNLLSSLKNNCCYPSTSDDDLKFIPSATQLREAGVKFKLFEEENTMFDIKFENGTLHIPKIRMGDYTERFLRNHIAYEQIMLRADRDDMHATDYMTFMDYLIDSPSDVEILRRERIIVNMLGDDIAVKTMINGLGAFVFRSRGNNFYYTKTFEKVNRHYNRPWNRRMANLKHNYFNSPWASISVMAAALLLVLTFLQTIFSATL